MNGILYGIGTGPGDSELMTIKAVKIMKQCDVLVLPVSDSKLLQEPVLKKAGEAPELTKGCIAYNIAYPNAPEISEKPVLFAPMPMIKNKEILKTIHNKSAEKIKELLGKGLKLGFLTLGDPTVYSTYLYIHKRILEWGEKAEIISGIPSFCASAARLSIGLVENREQLHIIPSSYGVDEAVNLSGTKVLMKAGKKMSVVKNAIRESGQVFSMVENCGMENEKIYHSVDNVPDEASYYSLIILKEKK